jgi:hypothetical protein
MEDYADRGARALVLLHEREMRGFLATWRRAHERGLAPPACDDPNYASLAAVLVHVLRAGRGYLVWLCETLLLPEPGVRPAPTAETAAVDASAFAEHLFERWRRTLAPVRPEQLDGVEARSRWGVSYSVDAMLEHAVMHPLRHAFQIEAWLAEDSE